MILADAILLASTGDDGAYYAPTATGSADFSTGPVLTDRGSGDENVTSSLSATVGLTPLSRPPAVHLDAGNSPGVQPLTLTTVSDERYVPAAVSRAGDARTVALAPARPTPAQPRLLTRIPAIVSPGKLAAFRPKVTSAPAGSNLPEWAPLAGIAALLAFVL